MEELLTLRQYIQEQHYDEAEVEEILADAFDTAIKKAALEAFEEQYSETEIAAKIDTKAVLTTALDYIKAEQK